jgi:hypothetical protein
MYGLVNLLKCNLYLLEHKSVSVLVSLKANDSWICEILLMYALLKQPMNYDLFNQKITFDPLKAHL